MADASLEVAASVAVEGKVVARRGFRLVAAASWVCVTVSHLIKFRLDVSYRLGGAFGPTLRRRLGRACGASARRARREITVRVIDFHSAGSLGFERSFRRPGGAGTRHSLRREVRFGGNKPEVSTCGIDARCFGTALSMTEITLYQQGSGENTTTTAARFGAAAAGTGFFIGVKVAPGFGQEAGSILSATHNTASAAEMGR